MSAKKTLDTLSDFHTQQQRIDLRLQAIQDIVSSPANRVSPQGPENNAVTVSPLPDSHELGLHAAAGEDDVKKLRQVLSRNSMDVNVRDADGRTAIYIAATLGNTKALNFLARQEAKLDLEEKHYGRTPLHYAVIHNHYGIIQTLLNLGVADSKQDDDGKLAIHYSTDECSTWMLTWGPGVQERGLVLDNEVTALMRCSQIKHHRAIEFLLANRAYLSTCDLEGRTALMHASLCVNSDTVSLLCEKGSPIETKDKHGDTALTIAATKGYQPTVRELLERGVNVRHRNTIHGRTALMCSITNGHWLCADELVQAGSNLEERDRYGFHQLGASAKDGKLVNVLWMLEAGANPNTRNKGSYTALHEAADHGQDEIHSTLLQCGACTELCTRGPMQTPLHYAARCNREYQVRRLLDAGANAGHINAGGWSILAEASSRGYTGMILGMVKATHLCTKHLFMATMTPHLFSWSTARITRSKIILVGLLYMRLRSTIGHP